MQEFFRPHLVSTSRYRKRNEGPGPAAYYPALGSLGPSISFAPRLKPQSIALCSPAPGTYNHDLKPTTPYYSFPGKSSGRIIAEEVPGPGAYNAKIMGEVNAAPIVINSISRFRTSFRTHQPGPGSYEARGSIPNGPSFSFGGNYKDPKDKVRVPGPGTYKASYKLLSYTVPNVDFTSSDRPSSVLSDFPGPGTYFDTRSAAGDISIDSGSPKNRRLPHKRRSQGCHSGIVSASPTLGSVTQYSDVGPTPLRFLNIDETDISDLNPVYNYRLKAANSPSAAGSDPLHPFSESANVQNSSPTIPDTVAPSIHTFTSSEPSPLFSNLESDSSKATSGRGKKSFALHSSHSRYCDAF